MIKDRVLWIWDQLRCFNRKVSIKVRLARIRKAKLEKFKVLGSTIFHLVLTIRTRDILKDPSVIKLSEELLELDREIDNLNLELKQKT